MDIVIVTVIAVGLLCLVWVVLGRSEDTGDAALPEESGFLPRLPQRSVIDRCFSPEDLEFAIMVQSPRLLRLYTHERRRLALAWLRQIRSEAGRLVRLHVRMARHAGDIRPAVELKILSNMMLFLLIHRCLVILVAFYGPFHARLLLRYAQGMANALSALGGRLAGSFDPALTSAEATPLR